MTGPAGTTPVMVPARTGSGLTVGPGDARPRRTGDIIYCNRCGAGPGLAGADRRHERGRAADGGPHRGRRRVGREPARGPRTRSCTPTPGNEHVPRHRVGDEQPLRRLLLHRLAPGYDLATGLGSIRARVRLGARRWTPPPILLVDSTRLDVIGPVDGCCLLDGHRVTFRGLIDTDHGQADRERAGARPHLGRHLPGADERGRRVVGLAVEGDRARHELARRLPRSRGERAGDIAAAQAARAPAAPGSASTSRSRTA